MDLLFLAPELAVVNASSKRSSQMLTKACISLETMGCDTGVATGGRSRLFYSGVGGIIIILLRVSIFTIFTIITSSTIAIPT